jgi:hypothetical protein
LDEPVHGGPMLWTCADGDYSPSVVEAATLRTIECAQTFKLWMTSECYLRTVNHTPRFYIIENFLKKTYS